MDPRIERYMELMKRPPKESPKMTLRKIQKSAELGDYILLRATEGTNLGEYIVYEHKPVTQNGELTHPFFFKFPAFEMPRDGYVIIVPDNERRRMSNGSFLKTFSLNLNERNFLTCDEGDYVSLVHLNDHEMEAVEER